MALNRSWPEVSHIFNIAVVVNVKWILLESGSITCSFTVVESSRLMVQVKKDAPMVLAWFE